jgi:hypothetical protein
MSKKTTKIPTAEEVATMSKTEAICALLCHLNEEEAQELCIHIHNTPHIYNLVMGGVAVPHEEEEKEASNE